MEVFFRIVTRMGLEPMTPTLKVLCSTSWASESISNFMFQKRVQRYSFFLNLPNKKQIFCKKLAFFSFFFTFYFSEGTLEVVFSSLAASSGVW